VTHSDENELTRILAGLDAGDDTAPARLLPLVYEELRQLAQRRMANEPPDHTLEPTALVHEAYLRLLGDDRANWDNRGHFFAAAAEAMRRILVERARRVGRQKRGGGRQRLDLTDDLARQPARADDVLALDEAIDRLEAIDKNAADVLKLRYFAGLTIAQTAETLGISAATVVRLWAYARAWLYEELTGDVASESS
jgi:RNA polymerase sigma factor (TIGR02999 family)